MRQNIQVPFGYEPPLEQKKGTLIYYDSFGQTADEELDMALREAKRRSFKRLVLYPLHEETVLRMRKEPVSAYYKRENRLRGWQIERGTSDVTIEGWEGKRKKYTPMDSALRYLTEKYPSPLFMYLVPEMANLFASFSSFEEWIVKIRLLLANSPSYIHPRLEKYRHRWDIASPPDSEERG